MTANLPTLLKLHGLPAPVTEYVFHNERKWRFDYCWPAMMLAAEQDGGGFVQGRHHRPKGFQEDCQKINSAVLLGWRVFRFTPEMIASGEAIETIRQMISNQQRR